MADYIVGALASAAVALNDEEKELVAHLLISQVPPHYRFTKMVYLEDLLLFLLEKKYN